jgi:hypothetical protein
MGRAQITAFERQRRGFSDGKNIQEGATNAQDENIDTERHKHEEFRRRQKGKGNFDYRRRGNDNGEL